MLALWVSSVEGMSGGAFAVLTGPVRFGVGVWAWDRRQEHAFGAGLAVRYPIFDR